MLLRYVPSRLWGSGSSSATLTRAVPWKLAPGIPPRPWNYPGPAAVHTFMKPTSEKEIVFPTHLPCPRLSTGSCPIPCPRPLSQAALKHSLPLGKQRFSVRCSKTCLKSGHLGANMYSCLNTYFKQGEAESSLGLSESQLSLRAEFQARDQVLNKQTNKQQK